MSASNYYSEESHGPHEYFELGDFELESGISLPKAKLAFKTHGALNKAKDNVDSVPAHVVGNVEVDGDVHRRGQADQS